MQRSKLIAVLFALTLLTIALPGAVAQSALAQPEELWEEFPLDSDKSPTPPAEGQEPAPAEPKAQGGQEAPQEQAPAPAPAASEPAADRSDDGGLPIALIVAAAIALIALLVLACVLLAARKRRRQRRSPAQPVPPSRKAVAQAQEPEPKPARKTPAATKKPPPVEQPAAKADAPEQDASEPVKAEAPPEPVTAEAPPEPVKAEAPVEPVEVEASPEPVKAEARPEPVKAEAPEPVKAEAPVEPVEVEASPEPVKAEPPPEPEPKKRERPAAVKAEPPPEPVKAERPAPRAAPPPAETTEPDPADLAPPPRIGGLPNDVIPFPTRPGRIGNRSGAGSPQLALGYVSATDADSQSGELEAQTEQIREACVRNGFDSVEVVRDFESHSGSDLERPGLIYALERLEAGEASALVVASLERLTRSAAHLGTLIDRLGESDIRLVVLDIELDTGDPDGRLAAEALANVGTLERKSLDIRTRKGLQAAREGRRSSGRPAVADRPALKDRIADMRARGMTLQAIADTLNSEGVPTLRGGAEWRPSSVQAAVGYKRPKRGARKAGNGSAEASSERNVGSSEGSLPTNSH